MAMQNKAADRWALAQARAKATIDDCTWHDGEVLLPWEDAHEQTVDEIRRQLPAGWLAEVETDGLVLRRDPDTPLENHRLSA